MEYFPQTVLQAHDLLGERQEAKAGQLDHFHLAAGTSETVVATGAPRS